MSRTERDKGARGEREVAAIFRAHGFDAERTPNSGGLRLKGDLAGSVLAGSVPAHLEVKRQEVLRLPAWLRQAETEAPAGVVPVVCFRQSRGGWYAALPLADLAAMMRAAAALDRGWWYDGDDAMSHGDEKPMPEVKRLCKRCPAYQDDVESGYVVSPTGCAHDGGDNGQTHCGIDATGPEWWWPL